MITESNVKLNVSKMNVLKDVFAKQKDSNSRFLNCVFFDGDGRRFIPITQGDVVINAERSDGLYHSFVGSINADGSVRVPLTNWMLDKAGDLTCSVTIYEGSEKLTTAAFRIFVEKAENPDGAISPDDPSTDVAQQLVLRAESAATQADDAVDEINTKFEGAGIHSKTYVTELDTTTVTTESSSSYPSYVATILEQDDPDALYRGYMYRITFDNVEYILPCMEWFYAGYSQSEGYYISTVFGIVGNLSLFEDSSGFYSDNPNVPFLLSAVMPEDGHAKNEGIFLFAQTQGTHTVKIERIEYDYTMLPEYMMYGSTIRPIYRKKDSGSASSVYSVGTNNLLNRRNAMAFGNCNTISENGYMAIGSSNTVTAVGAIGMGAFNTASGPYSRTFGIQSTASGAYSESHGPATTASGQMSTTHGYRTTANHKSQFVFGEYNTPDPSNASPAARGNYVEIVGNGTSVNDTSNARTLDWNGNESLAGGLTLGKGTDDEVTLTPAQLKRLIALLS